MNNAAPTFYNRPAIEREIESIENPHGMRLNDAKERPILPGGTLRRLLVVIDAQAGRIADLEAQLASGQYPVGRIESVDGGPNRHGVVVWLAHQGAPIKPGDKLYTHPAPTQQPPSEAQIDAAARALNRQAARECGINERDYWNLHADEFLADAKAALEAAHHIGEKK